MKIVVTGGTGYIGARLIRYGLSQGHEMVMFSRSRPTSPICPWVHYDLSATALPMLPAGADVVIHLALDTTKLGSDEGQSEILAANRLIEAALNAGAYFVFVSSQTARIDAPTSYGKVKWHIEQQVHAAGGCVVRPGQVYGGEVRGLFGDLVKLTKGLPVIPRFIPAPKVQPIHVDDLIRGLMRVSLSPERYTAPLMLAEPIAVAFTEFLSAISTHRLRVRRWCLPVPTKLLLFVLGLVGKTAIAQRLNSLFTLPTMETAPDLVLLKLTLRPLQTGMHCSGNGQRRELLKEASVLMVYVLRESAGLPALRTYARAIEQLRSGATLVLPGLVTALPACLALIDCGAGNHARWTKELRWRLDAATVLSEATPQGAARFLGVGKPNGWMRNFAGIAASVMREVFWRAIGLFARPLLKTFSPRALGGWE